MCRSTNLLRDSLYVWEKWLFDAPNVRAHFKLRDPTALTLFWSIDKPKEDEEITDVLTQVLECKNTTCKFSIYWYDK
jgi:hypothetical protein